MRPRKLLLGFVALAVLLVGLTQAGCPGPKDPYRAALQGSDGVSNGVHEAIVTISKLYSQGVASDEYKASAASYLDRITDCNMTFRKTVVQVHNSGQTGVGAFLPVADSFVVCARQQVKPAGPADSALQAVDTAINGISLAIQNAKGGSQP